MRMLSKGRLVAMQRDDRRDCASRLSEMRAVSGYYKYDKYGN